MAGSCSQTSCFPDETGCNVEGCPNVQECKYYGKPLVDSGPMGVVSEDDSYRIPWTGNSFGLVDLNFLTASSKPLLIGITGVASAGKTTFLASLYCLLRNGRSIGQYSFAGSLTLNGWEDIAWFLSWKENGSIQFPPHTANNSGRVPGLLHLALKNKDGHKVDLIFTDAPGEWFDHWRTTVNSENAKGAKWIHDKGDAFLLFSDCQMLGSENRGQARTQIQSVADRLCENLNDRPLALIWSKSDLEVSALLTNQIVQHIQQNSVKSFEQFQTSVREGPNGIYHQNICDSIAWIIEKLQHNINVLPSIESKNSSDMFLSRRLVYG